MTAKETHRVADSDLPRPIGAGLGAIIDRLRSRIGQAPAASDSDEWDDPAEYQQRIRLQAWRNTLVAAQHADYIDFTFDRLDPDQHPQVLAKFAATFALPDAPVRTLVLTGPIGTGKTAAAIAAGNQATANGSMVRFVKHSTYLKWLQPSGTPDGVTAAQIRDRFRAADLVILDDLGAEIEREASDFVRGETSDLLGDRLTSGRASIVTTNLTSVQLTAILGERLMSRLGAKAVPVKFLGSDRRKPATW